MRIYLIGFMGAGKTSVGRHLATQLGYPFVDLDDRIEHVAEMPVRAIFARLGEARFRCLEHEQLVATANTDDLVVATGGGTSVSAANRATMRAAGSVAVWLDPPFETIMERLDGEARESRPLWATENEARALYRTRVDDYRRTAGMRIRIEPTAAIDEIVTRVERTLRERKCAI